MANPNGVKLSFTYDVRGRLLAYTVAGRTWTYHRDAAGQITGISYPNGSGVTLSYDTAHRLTDVIDSLGNRQHRTLNVAGDVAQVRLFDASNTLVRQQSYGQDGLGRTTSATDANNQTATTRYDNNGNAIGSTDPLVRSSSVSYDALNRPATLTDAAGQVTAIQFNPYNQVTQIAAPNGAVTQYNYDSFRQLVQETSPDRGRTSITYSVAGLPTSRVDARGITASATYDALNRIALLSYSSPHNPGTPAAWLQLMGSSILSDNVSFTYDQGTGCTFGVGRLCARQDQSGTERYSYDTFGDLTQQTDTLLGYSYSTQYVYDTANQLTQMTYPDGRIESYTRDAFERLAAVQSTVNGVASPILSALQYRADGTPTSLTFGNGLTETRSYDPVGRLIHQHTGNVDLRGYGFDAVGNMTSKQTLAESDQFSYDTLNRLSAEQRTQGTSALSNGFSYDPNGNRLSENRDGTSTALKYLPNSNRLIGIGASTLTLDAAGNTTSDTVGARKFYYSAAGHLQWISQYGVPIAGYLYNALGQRTGKLTLQGITLYHYDIFGRLISETTIGSQPSRDYVWAGTVPFAQIDHWIPMGNMLQLAHCSVGTDGKIDWVTYLHTDELTTPRIGTDVSQNVVWRWDGEAFGESAPNQAVPGGAYPVYVNLRNPGQYFDQESGLFYNRARYYSPQVGRYISSDAFGLAAGVNTYAYVQGNPLLFVDPSGNYELSPFDEILNGLVETTDVFGLFARASPVIGAGVLGYGVGTTIDALACGSENCSSRLGGWIYDRLNPQAPWSAPSLPPASSTSPPNACPQ
jgi:RHS repeat-associated protein